MTKIEWAEETLNPVVGCSRISPGCDNCYAVRMAWRLAHNPKLPAEVRDAYRAVVHKKNGRLDWTGEVRLIPSVLDKPLQWRKPRRVFVCSMGDLFHPVVPLEWIEKVFEVMGAVTYHTFMVLTKRPDRLREFVRWQTDMTGEGYLNNGNVWLGVTAENQEQADKRIPILLDIPAAVRFVSIEPMLGPIEDRHYWGASYFQHLNWIILGGETGPGARRLDHRWARSIRDQCLAAGVSFFFKKWGDGPQSSCAACKHINHWAGCDRGPQCSDFELVPHWLDGREWNDFPGGHSHAA